MQGDTTPLQYADNVRYWRIKQKRRALALGSAKREKQARLKRRQKIARPTVIFKDKGRRSHLLSGVRQNSASSASSAETKLALVKKDSISGDQFYTKSEIAKECLDKLSEIVNFDLFDTIIEPSSGKGVFFNLLPVDKRIGIDLEPKCEGVIQMDYLDFEPPPNKRIAVVGNPPFGINSRSAVRFFGHSARFAEVIAFIIPRTWKRISVQNRLSLDFELIFNMDLPMTPCCFTPKMNAKCCFQIWVRTSQPRQKIRQESTHPDFEFLKMGPNDINGQPTPNPDADFVMRAYGSNCGQLYTENLMSLRPKSYHWIKARIDIVLLKERFEMLDYSISKDTCRQDSIGRKELIHLYKSSFN